MSLHEQNLTLALPETKLKLSILGTALVDALGAPPEFHRRFNFPWVTEMIPNKNFNLPPGVWTDDTSMTLCLAESLSTCEAPAGFDELHQLETYARWYNEGHLSAVGECFDIGNTISQALRVYAESKPEVALQSVRLKLSSEMFAGNGSLMRVLPIGLRYWQDLGQAKDYARRSSVTTHPTQMCLEACEVWTGAVVQTLQHAQSGVPWSKLNLLEYFATYPYQNRKLREALAMPADISPPPEAIAERERWYQAHHPVLHLISEMQARPSKGDFPHSLPSDKQLPSSGYVLHTLVAALYGFLATKTFEEGAVMVVNLGNDADTVGAVYAGLAACWYAGEEGSAEAEGVFWNARVRKWRKDLVRVDIVERIAEGLAPIQPKAEIDNPDILISIPAN